MRKLLSWLAKRFPEQLVVNLAAYDKLSSDVYLLGSSINDLRSQVVQLDAQVKRLNDQAGYVSSKKGSFALER